MLMIYHINKSDKILFFNLSLGYMIWVWFIFGVCGLDLRYEIKILKYENLSSTFKF